MPDLKLFTDGSVNAQSKIGFGAYLALPDQALSLEALKASVQLRRFAPTSSTRLELQTLLWALRDIRFSEGKVTVYTDSQNIVGLPGRRERLEQNDYRSARGRLLNNYDLYKEFYSLIDQLDCQFVKVRGHLPSQYKDEIERLFSLVDRASRQALRADKSSSFQG
jgi:ribonuclease HI